MNVAPVFSFSGVEKNFGGAAPFKLSSLVFSERDRIVLTGLDASGAEMFTHLLTGASLPDHGEVIVEGRATRDISTDTEWLASLDRFGLVSNRAVLLDQSTLSQNLALPLTLSIEPIPPAVFAVVQQLADAVGLDRALLDRPVGAISPAERMRAHLARAIALEPRVLLLEHPTSSIAGEGRAFGDALKRVSDARNLAWLAMSNDAEFAAASGGKVLSIKPDGSIKGAGGFLSRLFS